MLRFLVLTILFASATALLPTDKSWFKPIPFGEKATPKNANGRIVGGEIVDIINYPWQVSVQEYGYHLCGGSIISSTWVLTATHCLEYSTVNNLAVRAGSAYHASNGTIYPVSRGFLHAQYNTTTYNNDIAVLEVGTPFAVGTPGISIAALSSRGYYPIEGTVLYVSGWGLTESGGPSTVLRAVDVPAVSRTACRSVYGIERITDEMLCAGYTSNIGKDACNGDSGGPLVEGGTVVGVVSWGPSCHNLGGYPGVYADVGALRDWIETATGI